MNDPNVIHISLHLFLIAISVLIAVLLGCWMALRNLTGKSGDTVVHKWHVPVVDSNGTGNSFFHQWDVRIKFVALFTYCLCIAFLTSPVAAMIALALSFTAIFAGRLPLTKAMKRISAMIAFLSMFLIIMPLTAARHPGDPLVIIQSLPLVLNLRGFYLALTIILKAAAIALIMEPLFNTAPLTITIGGLQRIGVPAQVCQMLLMAHRYIFVFLHEINRMYVGMKVRGFRAKTNYETLRITGNFVGMLMVRSIDRTERVYQAMLARGYQGSFPVYHQYKSVPLDWLKALIWIGMGLTIIIFDLSGVI